jgi:hypothetical protein
VKEAEERGQLLGGDLAGIAFRFRGVGAEESVIQAEDPCIFER